METSELYYQIGQSQVQEQNERNREIDTKLASALGLAVTLGGITAVVLKDFTGNPDATVSGLTTGTALAVGGLFITVCFFALAGLRARDWRADPDLQNFSTLLSTHPKSDLVEWTGDQLRDSVVCNDKALNRKATHLNRTLASLGFMVLCLMFLAWTIYV